MSVQEKFSILSLNVRGLRNQIKRRSIFRYLKDQNCQLYLLQETFSESKDELIWKSEWGGDIFFSHGSTHSKGVCILINPSNKLSVETTSKDLDGRIVSINLTFNSVKISICSIYAPNDSQQQQKFLLTLNRYLVSHTDVSNLIIGGDWNVTLQAIDKKGGIPWRQTVYRDKLVSMMEDIGLIDIFRKLNPTEKSFSYLSKALKVSSRIDFFLVSKPIINWTIKANTKISNAPDHKAVKLDLKILSEKRGPGLWKFNNSLVEDNEYVKLIQENYPVICEKYADLKDDRLKWELIKMEIRTLTISYSKHKAKQRRNRETELQNRLEVLDRIISNCANSTQLEEYDCLKIELNRVYEAKGKGAIFRSKIRWVEQGEKPTKYFFNLEKRNFNRKVIKEIKRVDGTILVKEDEIMKEIESFYENLYASQDTGTNETFKDFVRNVQTVKLTDEKRDDLEGYITIEECAKVLKTFPTGKSPGDDGFTAEFYNCFFDLVSRDLVNSFNTAYKEGMMSISQRRGVITLVPKEDSYLSALSNWRPITLLNLDYKIVSKVIAKRIEKVLPQIIHSDQTGFVKGRYIGQNIRLINDILEQTKLQNIPGILLLLDFQKAFDTIEWSYIQNTLDLLNFGQSIKRWISTFYTNPESAVLNNGFSTNYFQLSRGVRQGCPLSPYLFILGVEILACKIRQDKEIQGIKIFNSEVKISQFADDTSLICNSCESVEKAIGVINSFGNISGLRLNPSKSKALWLGSWRNREEKPFGFKWPKEPVRALGIFISYDEKQNNQRNFLEKIQKLSSKLEVWRSRNLTILGRCLITKCLGIPQLVYSTSILDVPMSCIPTITTVIFQFIWKKKKDKIKRQAMYLNYEKGGLRVPNMDVMTKSLRLAWISRLLFNEGEWYEAWRTIPNHFLDKYGGLNFLLRCNYDSKFLDRTGMPQFYKLMLQFFLELKCAYKTDFGQDLVLFNNREIIIDGRTFFYKTWLQNGIFRIHDLLMRNGTFLSHGEFIHKYGIKCNFLQYLQVVSAVPKHLVEKAKQNLAAKFIFSQDDISFQLSPTININLLKMKSKDYYWLFMDKADIELKAAKKWARDLQSIDLKLNVYFKYLRNICKENKLREFYFKLLHRIIVTKKELFLYGIENNMTCMYCQESDSISHSFIHCNWSKEFFSEVIKWFNKENDTSFSLSTIEQLFGKLQNGADTGKPLKVLKKLNYALLFAKYYIYTKKLNSKKGSMKEFISKLEFKFSIEGFVS